MTNDTRAHSYLASFGSTINQFERLTAMCLDYGRFCLSCSIRKSKGTPSHAFKHPQVSPSRLTFMSKNTTDVP